MDHDPLATPTSSEAGIDTPFEQLLPSIRRGMNFGSTGFGALPGMANAQDASGANGSSLPQPTSSAGFQQQPIGGTPNMVASVTTERKPIMIKLNDQ